MKTLSMYIYTFSFLILVNYNDVKAFEKQVDAHFSADAPPVVNGNWYHPPLAVIWQWQLEGTINTSYNAEIYDVDLFDTPLSTIEKLHSRGKKVICYFSAGSYEDFREDKNRFRAEELGNTLENWGNERWLDIRSANVHAIMKSRLSLAQTKGCDGVEPDNVDGFTNNSGFDLTEFDQLAFNKFIANEAHRRGLSVGLKNDLEQVHELVDYFDFSINEQCFEYNECNTLKHFIKQGKPVLNAEYMQKFVTDKNERKSLCEKSNHMQFSTLILPQKLNDDFRYSCQYLKIHTN